MTDKLSSMQKAHYQQQLSEDFTCTEGKQQK